MMEVLWFGMGIFWVLSWQYFGEKNRNK